MSLFTKTSSCPITPEFRKAVGLKLVAILEAGMDQHIVGEDGNSDENLDAALVAMVMALMANAAAGRSDFPSGVSAGHCGALVADIVDAIGARKFIPEAADMPEIDAAFARQLNKIVDPAVLN